MATAMRLLLVEDSENDSALLLRHLKSAGIEPVYQRVETASAMTNALDVKEWDAVICDYFLPQFSAMAALALLRHRTSDLPCIVVSGSVGEALAVEAMKAGANDYIMKDNLARLVPALERELKESANRRQRKHIEDALKVSEAELRQAQKLESIGHLAGGIAHDFNNVLATILLQTDILNVQTGQNLPREQLIAEIKSGLEQINLAGEARRQFNSQLLAFSRKQVLQPKVVDLNQVIVDMKQMLVRLIEESIELKTTLAANLGHIKVDPGHLEQILLNLSVNSRDAMPQGGVLTIATENIEIDEAAAIHAGGSAGRYVLLQVTDTGAGMSAEVKDRIFEPFFTTKAIDKGTGLGLSTVYGIVKQNRGIIAVESQVGKGTIFKIHFPVVDEALEKAATTVSPLNGPKGNETVMVVEDEDSLRDLVTGVLKSNGYNVLTAINGVEALDMVRAHVGPIHLIITDVVMPKMGGTELAQEVQKIDKNIKILFQSGYIEDTLVQNGIRAGQIHFLEKPYSRLTLLQKIRATLAWKPE